jgi:23S rRNA pseudouridine1911/1915/1917 synthase
MKQERLIEPHASFSFIREHNTEPIRLDRYLAELFPLYSRSFFKKLIEESFVSVNEKKVQKQGTPVHGGDAIAVRFPGKRLITSPIEPQDIPVQILGQTDHFAIISKPVGLLVHPPHTHSGMLTLMDWLVQHFKELELVGYVDRPGIVHRLDKDTSGIMIIPRTNIAHTFFTTAFRERTIHKTYHALVQGHPAPCGVIDLAVGRHPQQRAKMHAFPHDYDLPHPKRSAVTHYKVLEYFTDTALLELAPVTGRTHQLRVHCAAIGHAIVGDPVYGMKSKKIKRQALHARSLAFTFAEQPYYFDAPYPEDFAQLIADERIVAKE